MFNQTKNDSTFFPSFNLRSTMPSSFNRTNIKTALELNQREYKSHADNLLNTTNPSDNSLNSFFVRVSNSNLEQQRRIYKWRMNCSENFIGISSIKLQSEGNLYNPNLLFKVDMMLSKSNFVQVKDLCLTKCVTLMKQILAGITTLLEYFDPIVFTDKMIYLTDKGLTKVWMDQRFYINPHNDLYCKPNKQVSVQQSLKSVIQIFHNKCLKTKLSTKLFSSLSYTKNFYQAIHEIQNFEKSQSLFPIQGLKASVSTGYALNSSISLQFSRGKSSKKKKINDKQIEKDSRSKNLAASHKFLQAKSMQINPKELSQSQKIRQQKMTYQSQHEVHQKKEQQGIRKTGLFLEVNPEKPSTSIVISEMFQSNNEMGRGRNPTEPLQSNLGKHIVLKAQQKNTQENLENSTFESILTKNGWSTNMISLFERQNIKQSFAEGKQQNSHLRGFKLKKLHTMGKDVRQSILPVDEEDADY